MTKELEDRLESLENELRVARKSTTRKKLLFLSVTLAIIAASIVGGLVLYKPWQPKPATSDETTALSGLHVPFAIYFYDKGIPAGFDLDKNSVSAANGVIIFKLVNASSKKEVIFTEQAVGSYDYTQLKADLEFRTQYGQAFITDGQSRTTGTLFTDDKTWILANAPQPIGSDVMQELLNGLSK